MDVGGSKIDIGLVTQDGRLLSSLRIPSHPSSPREVLLGDISDALSQFAGESVSGLGLGIPALCNIETGVVIGHGVFPSLDGFPIRDHMEQELGVAVRINTDANLFTLGVLAFGEGKQFRDFVLVTLGTGMGVGVVVAGTLIVGEFGLHDRVRQMLLEENWQEHRYHSGFMFEEVYGVDGESLQEQARGGDDSALEAYRSIGSALADTVHRLSREFDSEAVIFGGGVARGWRFFAPSLGEKLTDSAIKVIHTRLSSAALLGAAPLFDS